MRTLQYQQFRIALDDVSVARLIEVAESCHATPEQVIASIVHDVLQDDALAHDAAPDLSAIMRH